VVTVLLTIDVDLQLVDDFTNAVAGLIRSRAANGVGIARHGGLRPPGDRGETTSHDVSNGLTGTGDGGEWGRVSPMAGAVAVLEAAKMLGISRSTLYRRWKHGDGPRSFHLGRRHLVPIQAIQELLDS
jgi:predicted DNA-binding transcriptional regulator AlpA